MDSSTRVVVNTGIQYVRTVVQVAIMLYTSRVVLDNLGVEDYGIYNLVGGVIAMLSFIQISHSRTASSTTSSRSQTSSSRLSSTTPLSP